MSHPHVDREHELRIFRDILEARREERILLVEAPPGRGKTLLLLEYQKIASQHAVPYVALDLRVGGVGVHDVLAAMGEEWGWENFASFRRHVEGLLRPTERVVVSGVVQIGRPQIQVVLGQPDEQARRERRRLLTTALFEDLRAWLGSTKRAVFFLDTYNPKGIPETVEPEMKEWLEGAFLTHARRTPGLIVVVAGQQVPSVNVAWETCCHRLNLPPLDDPEDWMEFVRALGLRSVSLEIVSAFCHRYRGEPIEVATSLSALQDWGGDG